MKIIIILFLATLHLIVFGQTGIHYNENKSYEETKLKPQKVPEFMKFIAGGTFITPEVGYEFYYDGPYLSVPNHYEEYQPFVHIEDPNFNIEKSKRVSISSFYLSDHEVTCEEYLEFMLDSAFHGNDLEIKKLKNNKPFIDKKDKPVQAWIDFATKCKNDGIFPDTSGIMREFPGLTFPFDLFYYCIHPNYAKHPILFVTWEQANGYCKWFTEKTNARLKKEGQPLLPAFRLPTEMEWVYAASCFNSGSYIENEIKRPSLFPTGKSLDRVNFLANYKNRKGIYNEDGFEYSAPIKSFPPDQNKIYDLAGNAAEWCQDSFLDSGKRLYHVVKGGSWADYYHALFNGSRTGIGFDFYTGNENASSFRVGFRMAMIVINTSN